MTHKAVFAALSVLVLLPLQAQAQCRADIECKGSRICVRGECVEGGPARSAPVSPAIQPARPYVVPERPADAPDPGWGRSGAIVGLLGGVGTLGMALVAEGMNADGTDATGLGAAAIVLGSASAITAGLASSSVRGVEHSAPLRVVGWVAFGLALGDALVLVGTPEVRKPDGLITSVGVLAFIGVGALSIEAMISAGEAEAAVTRPGAVSVVPFAAPVRLADGSAGASFGVVGRF
jgi:hypothetical protein